MDDDDDYVETRSVRFLKADLFPLVLGLIEGLTGAIHEAAQLAYNVAARHANHAHEQDAFRREAALEIETLTGDTDG